MERRLSVVINRAQNIPYYKKLWGKGAKFELNEFPLSSKELFSPQRIEDSIAVKEAMISYYYFSAGTTGSPKMIPFTQAEWAKKAAYRGECYKIAGVKKKDKVAILLPFGPWVAGPSVQSALIYIGCTVFPLGLLSEDDEIKGLFSLFSKHSVDTIITTPSFAQRVLYLYQTQAIKVSINRIITSGEYIADSVREELKNAFGVETFSSYASSESFIGIECSNHSGFHFNPGEVIVETIDDSSYSPTNNIGQIIITALASEAIPLIRYPLGDIGLIDYSQCSCGISWPRIIWKGRQKEIFEVAGGVNVWSYQIRGALSKCKVLISKCEIEIFDNGSGRDFIKFNLHTRNQLSTREKEENIKEIRQLLENMSIDFNDVIHHKAISIEIALDCDTKPSSNLKMLFKIYDRREHSR